LRNEKASHKFPVKQKPEEVGAIRVNFDLLPTAMSFDLPWTYCMVTENNIKFANLAAETYDPRDFDGTGGLASFEPGMDDEGRYVRAWIEHQSDARIVVRIRYALNNNLGDIAHPDIPSGSPYGKGDWTDEWHYIYPDGTNIRRMRIYTGLAPVSRPFGFDREPPSTVHEFMESVVIGQPGHVPTDDIEIEALTLFKMFGGHSEELVSLAWSWITDPPLRMDGLEDEYGVYTYDPAQKAYIVPRKGRGPVRLEWMLDEPEDGPMHIINPAFIIKDWDREGFVLKMNGKLVERGRDFRAGYEDTPTGSDLVLWIRMHAQEAVEFELSPLKE